MRSASLFRRKGSPTRPWKVNDDGELPLRSCDESLKRRRKLVQRFTKRWYKSDYEPICVNFTALLDLRTVTKRRWIVKAKLVLSVSASLLVAFLCIRRLWSKMRGQLHNRRTFPLEVWIEGGKLLPIQSRSEKLLDFPLVISMLESQLSTFQYPGPLNHGYDDYNPEPEYEIEIRFMEQNVTRVIYHDELGDLGEVRDYSLKDDDVETYYAYDDDFVRDVIATYDDDEIKGLDQGSGQCRRLNWHRYHFLNCNTFHEMDLAVRVPTSIGFGAYREVYTHSHEFLSNSETVVWKGRLWAAGDFTYDMYEFTRMDALITERFTSDVRFVDIYGYCATSMLAEYLSNGNLEEVAIPGSGFISQTDLHDQVELRPQNKFTPHERFRLALEMAELIAALHEYPQGMIVHNDIQPSQFLFDSDGTLKFNDFNRGEILLWNEKTEEYCRYRNGPGSGNFRAPEEFYDKALREKIDVYSYGNNLYVLMTGLWPFYEDDDSHEAEVHAKLMRGEKPFVDSRYRNRSIEDAILVDIMEACWAFNPDDRPDIQSLVRELRLSRSELEHAAGRPE